MGLSTRESHFTDVSAGAASPSTYIFSGASMPRTDSPLDNVRAARSHSASRCSRSAPSELRTGQAS
jgi:hypothetical protein